ncbi:unnamed protein product [Rotaria sp. Silwood1]|nr:unnamed protein product [Rotaria sp. Silwood1]CAF1451225.1 unnamed protein product [Rotaria sp. Silwood1]CAF4868382.1 unnamed protein product [Rotaria sp. Silwood1]
MMDVCRTVSTKLPAIYYGNQGWAMREIEYISSWICIRPIVILLFTDWCNTSMNNLFNYQLNNIWNNQSIPVITWELFGCGGSSQSGIMQLVRNNTYDTYINQFGDRLKLWLAGNDGVLGSNDDRRAYLRLGMMFIPKLVTCVFQDRKQYNYHDTCISLIIGNLKDW